MEMPVVGYVFEQKALVLVVSAQHAFDASRRAIEILQHKQRCGKTLEAVEFLRRRGGRGGEGEPPCKIGSVRCSEVEREVHAICR